MKARSFVWSSQDGWSDAPGRLAEAGLVLYFGGRADIEDGIRAEELRQLFPAAQIVGCSTGGQIYGGDVEDERVVALALRFAKTRVGVAIERVCPEKSAFKIGEDLAFALAAPDLRGIFVLSDGLHVNGSELAAGLLAAAGQRVCITGGLAGDGPHFGQTVVGANARPVPGNVVAVGFYGDAVRFGTGSAGGWDEFGPQRVITKSQGNVLYELDGSSALGLYERYLGDEAAGLPGTALLYPLLLRNPAKPAHAVVRTVLAVDRDAGTMTFAGDLPVGWSAQLMRGYFDRLADAAGEAARQASIPGGQDHSDVAALLVSCIGRRILMGQSIIDEVAAAEAALGPAVQIAGFYSYGELAPQGHSGLCELHNQTMTVTTITEV